ncbi:hypothetical protein PC111_g22588 [Phytophthora cactorum]|nr:hypothetical protein PC111_g22588 [Phytophthora cactorum]
MTEFTLSVGEYHALQYKKRVEDKAVAPETIPEGSTEKSRPQQPTPSRPQSRMIRSQGCVNPVKTIRALQVQSARVIEEAEKAPTPVTPSPPRSVPTERAPWMPSTSEIASRFGAILTPNQIPLYVCGAIIDDAEAAAQHFDPMTNQRRGYYIGLFHEL